MDIRSRFDYSEEIVRKCEEKTTKIIESEKQNEEK